MRVRTRAAELQGHYAGAISRLLAYGADLLILSVTLTVTLALTQFAIEVATPWKVNFENEEWLVITRMVPSGIAGTTRSSNLSNNKRRLAGRTTEYSFRGVENRMAA